jgi:two-component system, OmpR family, osmolarity sensor histidine kinase EnvZ
MARGFLHRFSPASFYGRAVLILIIPIIVIQIVVSVVFIQRHYERVTAQMTTNVLRDLTFLTQRLEHAADPQSVLADLADLTQILQISVQVFPDGTPPPPAQPISRLDLAGREIVRVLSANLAGFRAADLRSPSGEVRLWLDSRHGVIELGVPRGLVTTSNPHQLLVIVFLASVLMTLIAFQFLRLQIRPIRRLGAAAEAYGRGERVALRPSGAREIRAAAHAFMDMRNRIERARVQQKIMLSGVSHDMRTPLTRMRLILSMMTDDEDRAALETEITDLEKRLEGFLDYTRGQMAEERAPTDPRALVADLIERYRMAGHEIGVQIAEKVPPTLALNAGTISRALDNLISNALRHGTRVRVTCEVSRPWLEISVEDNGPGIPEPDRARACEPFARLDEARNSDSGGLGLGLAIAAEAARAHGGALVLEDGTHLGGLRAVLQLPLPHSL